MYWTKAFYKMNEKEKDKVFEELEKKYVNLDIYIKPKYLMIIMIGIFNEQNSFLLLSSSF